MVYLSALRTGCVRTRELRAPRCVCGSQWHSPLRRMITEWLLVLGLALSSSTFFFPFHYVSVMRQVTVKLIQILVPKLSFSKGFRKKIYQILHYSDKWQITRIVFLEEFPPNLHLSSCLLWLCFVSLIFYPAV